MKKEQILYLSFHFTPPNITLIAPCDYTWDFDEIRMQEDIEGKKTTRAIHTHTYTHTHKHTLSLFLLSVHLFP